MTYTKSLVLQLLHLSAVPVATKVHQLYLVQLLLPMLPPAIIVHCLLKAKCVTYTKSGLEWCTCQGSSGAPSIGGLFAGKVHDLYLLIARVLQMPSLCTACVQAKCATCTKSSPRCCNCYHCALPVCRQSCCQGAATAVIVQCLLQAKYGTCIKSLPRCCNCHFCALPVAGKVVARVLQLPSLCSACCRQSMGPVSSRCQGAATAIFVHCLLQAKLLPGCCNCRHCAVPVAGKAVPSHCLGAAIPIIVHCLLQAKCATCTKSLPRCCNCHLRTPRSCCCWLSTTAGRR